MFPYEFGIIPNPPVHTDELRKLLVRLTPFFNPCMSPNRFPVGLVYPRVAQGQKYGSQKAQEISALHHIHVQQLLVRIGLLEHRPLENQPPFGHDLI
jgi:hypothetical protein